MKAKTHSKKLRVYIIHCAVVPEYIGGKKLNIIPEFVGIFTTPAKAIKAMQDIINLDDEKTQNLDSIAGEIDYDSKKFTVECYAANRLLPFPYTFDKEELEEIFADRKEAMLFQDKTYHKLYSKR